MRGGIGWIKIFEKYSNVTLSLALHTVIRLVEDKMRRFNGECEHFRFNKCPIYTHDGASAKFRTNSHETDNSVGILFG